jgi:hypothetical protein
MALMNHQKHTGKSAYKAKFTAIKGEKTNVPTATHERDGVYNISSAIRKNKPQYF